MARPLPGRACRRGWRALLTQQHATWPLLRAGTVALAAAQYRALQVNGSEVLAQWSNVVITLAHEPTVCVGVMAGVQELSFALDSAFATPDGRRFTAGGYRAAVARDRIAVYEHTGQRCAEVHELSLRPRTPATATFTIHGVTIGLDFHWQRQEDQHFHC